MTAGGSQTHDFAGLAEPGNIAFAVKNATSGAPLDARIVIDTGNQPVVEFLGRKTFFTELIPQGQLEVPIAPGAFHLVSRSPPGVESVLRNRMRSCRPRRLPGQTAHCQVDIKPCSTLRPRAGTPPICTIMPIRPRPGDAA